MDVAAGFLEARWSSFTSVLNALADADSPREQHKWGTRSRSPDASPTRNRRVVVPQKASVCAPAPRRGSPSAGVRFDGGEVLQVRGLHTPRRDPDGPPAASPPPPPSPRLLSPWRGTLVFMLRNWQSGVLVVALLELLYQHGAADSYRALARRLLRGARAALPTLVFAATNMSVTHAARAPLRLTPGRSAAALDGLAKMA